MKCTCYKSNKRSYLNEKRGVENIAMTTNDKINGNSDNSLQKCHEQSISNCSTPIAKKSAAKMDVEESPDLDYFQSPILLPYTQESGNEVAWDWQTSLNRTPENRKKQQKVQCETPKGTKLLQKKRNSNSPLLYKPYKRKAIKRENIENIGQFAAELQALNEKMRVIKQDDRNHKSECAKEEKTNSILESKNIEKNMPEIKDELNKNMEKSNNKQNSIRESNHHDSKMEISGTYEDLFDDSVDDDMIRCTQEMEEKFKLIEHTIHSQSTEKGSNAASNKTSLQYNEDYKISPLVINVLGASDSNTLRTYSKLSKRDVKSSIHVAAERKSDSYKSYLSDNSIIQSHIKPKPCDSKKLLKSNTIELFDFPDDSFDDWLGECIDDEKALLESNGFLTNKDDNTKFQTNYKHLTNAPLKSETKFTDYKAMIKSGTSNVSSLENRKFFKTKSLSDQHFNWNTNANTCYATRPMLQHMNSSRSSNLRTNARTLVSTKPITNNRTVENNSISLMHDVDRTHGSNVNRYAVKSDGDHFVKHHSTGNMRSDTSKSIKTGSQPMRCTAEEIEKKRLQAVARLEAKRKLYMAKLKNGIR